MYIIKGRDPVREAWPTCPGCGEELIDECYHLYGEDYCRECAEEIVRDNLLSELVNDYLADRRGTPTWQTSI